MKIGKVIRSSKIWKNNYTNGHSKVKMSKKSFFFFFVEFPFLNRNLFTVMIAILLGTENYSRNKFTLSPFVENLSQKTHRIFIESATLSLLPVQIVAKLNFPVWKRFVAAANSAMEQGNKKIIIILHGISTKKN